jgi:hypothetical protein
MKRIGIEADKNKRCECVERAMVFAPRETFRRRDRVQEEEENRLTAGGGRYCILWKDCQRKDFQEAIARVSKEE